MGGTLPVSAAISGSASSSLSRKHSNLSNATDESIWRALWDLCNLSSAKFASTMSLIAADFNLHNFVSLQHEDSCASLNAFSTAILTAVPHWREASTMPLKQMAAIFTNVLPPSCKSALEHYNTQYSNIRCGAYYLRSIEPWNLFMAVTVLDSLVTYSREQRAESRDQATPFQVLVSVLKIKLYNN
jgi:hypothetical protein